MSLFFAPLAASTITVTTMIIGEAYTDLVKAGIANKIDYCKKHGYNFHLFTESMDHTRPIPWTKIKIIQSLFEDPTVEWVFWNDADSLFMNLAIPLSQFIDPAYDIIFASDFNGINSGQFLIKNSKWSKKFLEKVYNQEQFIHHHWWEQAAIMHLHRITPAWHSRIKILHQRALNSASPDYFPSPDCHYQKGDFILHFAGLRGAELKQQMEKFALQAE